MKYTKIKMTKVIIYHNDHPVTEQDKNQLNRMGYSLTEWTSSTNSSANLIISGKSRFETNFLLSGLSRTAGQIRKDLSSVFGDFKMEVAN